MDLSKSAQEAIDSSIRDWLQSHWPLGWIVTNLWLSLLLLLISIVLFWGLLGALGRGVQQGWIWVLRSPLKLLGLLKFQPKADGLLKRFRLPDREQKIESVIQQLAINQQQQVQLLAELSDLVNKRIK
jgi:hypothetical protein